MTGPEVLLLRPLWLAGLPLALVVGALVARRADGLGAWRAVIDADLLDAMRGRGWVSAPRNGAAPWLMSLAMALLLAGLAGPASRAPNAPVPRNTDRLMILLDLSPSMTEGGSLDDAQAALARLIDIEADRPTGLIVYAGESFLASVPTDDPGLVQGLIAVADGETMPVGGTRPDRALTLARRALADAGARAPDVVLVSDGGGMGPEAAEIARRMAAEGSRVSAIFVPEDAPPYGMPSASRTALAAVAEAGGGRLADATAPAGIDRLLPRRRDRQTDAPDLRALQYRDHGPWLAALALLPLAALFRRPST
ncbi:vWA domain-containing protein [Rhodovulum kholense]|uniref:Ca-activated chloride channel family protein n=1 Tax=Rhodovulum kholense TaxID=453584 RepID=A0A8E3AQ88_9RHOB|nr:vWA domain-containing protein [Rhodovulum kholense]PTW48273.1 Ca-activated chloride channel family protein [Rhodovulum kholense]